jgi:hypothetical protein
MGAWGTGILENDLSADVHDDYLGLFEQGRSPVKILRKLKKDYKSTLKDPDVAADFWFALAHAQLETRSLHPEVMNQVRLLIQERKGMDVWLEDPDLWPEREAVLTKFLEELTRDK